MFLHIMVDIYKSQNELATITPHRKPEHAKSQGAHRLTCHVCDEDGLGLCFLLLFSCLFLSSSLLKVCPQPSIEQL